MANWRLKLSNPIETRDGDKFTTLANARAFVIKQPDRNEWHWAAGKLLAAAESGNSDDIAEATKALRSALFLDGLRLKL